MGYVIKFDQPKPGEQIIFVYLGLNYYNFTYTLPSNTLINTLRLLLIDTTFNLSNMDTEESIANLQYFHSTVH